VRPWPDGKVLERDPETVQRIADACADVTAAIRSTPADPSVEDIPFERGDGYIDQNTDLDPSLYPSEEVDGSDLDEPSDEELAELEPSDD